jgi:type IV pilus assembly protein PilE
MQNPNRLHLNSQLGFTLIELMITVAIATILVSIALPSYLSHMRKSRRTEARTALLDIASREERLFSTTNSYSNVPTDLGYSGTAFPIAVGNGFYNVNVSVTAAAPPAPATFTITATATGSQSADTQCASFTVDQAGRQSAYTSSSAVSTQTCWK